MSEVQDSESKAERSILPSIYPITDTRISRLPHREQIERLIAGGASLIQLREKHASPREFYEQVVECIAYARPLGVRIIVNDRVDIALMTDADGVHLGQDDMSPQAAREILGRDKYIGYSTHSVAEAYVAAASGVDYIAIGPVFATSTKDSPEPTVGLEGIAAVRKAIGHLPLVAIGGVNASNLADVLSAGADSVAVISGILAEPDIVGAMRSHVITALNAVQK